MNTPLRPLTTAELLDRTFHLYRNNFVLFAGIATVASASVVLASLLLTALDNPFATGSRYFNSGTLGRDIAIYFGVHALFYILGASLATGATIYAASRVHLDQPVNINESYSKVWPALGRLLLVVFAIILRVIGMLLLGFLGLVVIIFVLGLIFVGVHDRAAYNVGYYSSLVGVLVVYLLPIWLYFKYSVAIQACLLENARTNQSIIRSRFLTQDYRWRIFLVYLLTFVIAWVLGFVLHWPITLLRGSFLAVFIWQYLATFFATTISFPISTIAISLLYYDLRVRKEAFDLQLMMESLGQPQGQAAAAPIG